MPGQPPFWKYCSLHTFGFRPMASYCQLLSLSLKTFSGSRRMLRARWGRPETGELMPPGTALNKRVTGVGG